MARAQTVRPGLDSIICRGGEWRLVFEDDFSGTGLDTSAWVRYYPYGPGGSDACSFCRTHSTAASPEGQVYLDRNVTVGGGALHLRLAREDTAWYEFDRRYTSGMIHSRARYPEYARFEIRCRVPLAKGIWPAFWMFGGSTELDVFEFYGTRGGSQRRLDRYEASVHKWGERHSAWGDNWVRVRRADAEWHVYAVEYDAAAVRFFLDDTEVARLPKFTDADGRPVDDCTLRGGQTYTIHPEYPVYGVPLSVIVNVAVRGSYVDKRIKGLPLEMEVDWVRVWER